VTVAPANREPTGAKAVRRAKPPIPFYWWPLWMLLLVIALIVFYGILTPVWMGIRLVAWTTERSSRRGRRARGAGGGAAARP
jgi:hypothetical protein